MNYCYLLELDGRVIGTFSDFAFAVEYAEDFPIDEVCKDGILTLTRMGMNPDRSRRGTLVNNRDYTDMLLACMNL